MKTQQIMKREFLGEIIRQNHKTGMVSISDISKLSTNKKPADFMRLDTTKEFINQICKEENLTEDKVYSIIRGRGEKAGTWTHPLLALDFAMWVNPSFKYHAMVWVRDNLCQFRDMCGDGFNEMKEAILTNLKPTRPWVYANEAIMVQSICGIKKGERNQASEEQLKKIEMCQRININLLNQGIRSIAIRESKIRETLKLISEPVTTITLD